MTKKSLCLCVLVVNMPSIAQALSVNRQGTKARRRRATNEVPAVNHLRHLLSGVADGHGHRLPHVRWQV